MITQAPVFTMPVRDIRVAENQAVHFEARLIPVGDPKLKIEWLRNGVPLEACMYSRPVQDRANALSQLPTSNIKHIFVFV